MLVFKLRYIINSEPVVRSLPFQDTGTPTWETIATRIEELFFISYRDVAIAYVDDDGDRIVISSQVELEDYYATTSFCQLCKEGISDNDHGLWNRCVMNLKIIDLAELRQNVQSRSRSPSSLSAPTSISLAQTPISEGRPTLFESTETGTPHSEPPSRMLSPAPIAKSDYKHLPSMPENLIGDSSTLTLPEMHSHRPKTWDVPPAKFGGPMHSYPSQPGQVPWVGFNSNPQFTESPTLAKIWDQMTTLGQRPQRMQMLKQDQQSQSQRVPFLPLDISQSNSQQQNNEKNNQMIPQQLEHLLLSSPAVSNQTPFLLPQQSPQLQRGTAISADHPDVTRQFQLLGDGAGIGPDQNREPILGHQQPGQPQQPRTSMMGPQSGGMPIQNSDANLIPPQWQHSLTSPNLGAGIVPQRGPSQMNFQSGKTPPPQSSYDQLILKLKQMQNEISQTEMELNIISRTRPSEAGRLPDEYAKLQRKKQQISVLQGWKNALESAGGQLRQNGCPTPPNPPQAGQISWNGSNPNPQFTGVPTPVYTPGLQNQLALLGQRLQGIQMPRQSQQSQPQQFPFLPPVVSQPNSQQQKNEQLNAARNPQNFVSQEAYLQHLRQRQQPTQQPPQSQAPQQQQKHGQNPSQVPQNQWLQQPQPTSTRPSVAEFMAKMRGVPPLEREKFVNALRVFFEKGGKNPALIETPITLDNHRFMLWDLHKEVITNGTSLNVNNQNLWPVIGAKLGFPIIQQTGIPRASDRIGDFVRECHKTYLLQFEQAYLSALGKSFANSNNSNTAMNGSRLLQLQEAQQPSQQHSRNPSKLPQSQRLQQRQSSSMRPPVTELMAKMRGVPPLEKEKFMNSLREFFEKGGKNPASIESPIQFDNHKFMLWDLHREVITNGTFVNVNNQNLWPVIGAKLGFPIVQQAGIQRASDRIGDFLREYHKSHLLQFEQAYLSDIGSFANRERESNERQSESIPRSAARSRSPICVYGDLNFRSRSCSPDYLRGRITPVRSHSHHRIRSRSPTPGPQSPRMSRIKSKHSDVDGLKQVGYLSRSQSPGRWSGSRSPVSRVSSQSRSHRSQTPEHPVKHGHRTPLSGRGTPPAIIVGCSLGLERLRSPMHPKYPALLMALTQHLSNLANDPRLGRVSNAELTTLTNELLPELSFVTQAVNSLAYKVGLIDKKRNQTESII